MVLKRQPKWVLDEKRRFTFLQLCYISRERKTPISRKPFFSSFTSWTYSLPSSRSATYWSIQSVQYLLLLTLRVLLEDLSTLRPILTILSLWWRNWDSFRYVSRKTAPPLECCRFFSDTSLLTSVNHRDCLLICHFNIEKRFLYRGSLDLGIFRYWQ